MKSAGLFLSIVLFSSLSLGASLGLDKIACDHLKNLRIGCGDLSLHQDTQVSQFFVSSYVGGTEDFPCHIGVVVDKARRAVSRGEGDAELNIDFPYSDIFPDLDKKVYWICAD